MRNARGDIKTTAQALLEDLKTLPEGESTAKPRLPSQGVTACGRWAWRIDAEGYFFAAPLDRLG